MNNKPIFSNEAEQSVLGGLMMQPNDEVLLQLEHTDFFKIEHQQIFRAIQACAKDNIEYDPVTLSERLQGTNVELGYLVDLANNTPSAANTGAYARIVKERAYSRRMLGVLNDAQEIPYSSKPSQEKMAELIGLIDSLDISGSKEKSLQEIVASTVEILEHKHENPGVSGLSTGFHAIDNRIDGMNKKHLIILAGRPAMGKTTKALNIARSVLMDGKRVLGFSLEMPAESWIQKMASDIGGIDFGRLRTGQLQDEEWGKFAQAMSEINNSDFVIDDSTGITINDIKLKSRMENKRKKLDLILIDYLQKVKGGAAESESLRIDNVVTDLKDLAKELDCPVLVLAQVNRGVEQRADRRPNMSDLKASGAIEQEADEVLIIYRHEVYFPDDIEKHGIAEIICAKNRFGEIGRDFLYTRLAQSKFLNIEKGDI